MHVTIFQAALWHKACAQNAGNEKTPHFLGRLRHVSCGAAIPALFVRHCLFCCLAPLGLASQYPQSTIAISSSQYHIVIVSYRHHNTIAISSWWYHRDICDIQYLQYPWYPSTIAISSTNTLNCWHMVLEGFPYALNDILCFTQISNWGRLDSTECLICHVSILMDYPKYANCNLHLMEGTYSKKSSRNIQK